MTAGITSCLALVTGVGTSLFILIKGSSDGPTVSLRRASLTGTICCCLAAILLLCCLAAVLLQSCCSPAAVLLQSCCSLAAVLLWAEEMLQHLLTQFWDQIFTKCWHNLYNRRSPGPSPGFLPDFYLYFPWNLHLEGKKLSEKSLAMVLIYLL